MGWIGDTLKTIILVILLAVFVDLIIPGKAMQRYVKVVISLFILMTILQPVLQLLHTDFNLEKLQFPILRSMPTYLLTHRYLQCWRKAANCENETSSVHWN